MSMKMAYLIHNLTLMLIQKCESENGKKEIAMEYFIHNGQAMNEYMVNALYLIELLEERIKNLEGALNGKHSD